MSIEVCNKRKSLGERYEEREKALLEALEKEENLPVLNELGRLYVKQKKFDEAEKTFKQALEKGNLPSLNELGMLYVKLGRDEDAEEAFWTAWEAGNLPSLNELGMLYVRMGREGEAEEAFRYAWEGGNLPSLNELGMLYVKQGKYKKAEDILLGGLEEYPDNQYLRLSLCSLYLSWGRLIEAERAIAQVKRMHSESNSIVQMEKTLRIKQKGRWT